MTKQIALRIPLDVIHWAVTGNESRYGITFGGGGVCLFLLLLICLYF